MHDPQLTELGIQQCTELRKAFPHHENIDLIVASPLRRTIYTALYSFEPVLKAEGAGDKKVIALPLVQETADVPCDTGSDPEVLVEEFLKEGKHPVDLGLVEEGWNSKVRTFCSVGFSCFLLNKMVICLFYGWTVH